MTMRRIAVLALMIVCLGGLVLAQEEEASLQNWTAPPYWQPTPQRAEAEGESGGGLVARSQGLTAEPQALPSAPLPFVAIAPCRIIDTRPGYELPPPFGGPTFGNYETRTYDFSVSTQCPGIPATAGAYSLNLHARTTSIPGFITVWPTGMPRPTASNFVSVPTENTAVAAIVPAGTAGQINAYCNSAGDLWIDINGYYGPQSVVTSLNTKTGDVTLAEGSNVTITPSGQTLTIAATGGPGGELPLGSANQTLRHNGSAWVASSVLTNDGSTTVGVSGNLALPSTTGASSGVLTLGGQPFLHAAGATTVANTFVGSQAGSFATSGMGGNVGVGVYALSNIATGYYNTAVGGQALSSVTGDANSAFGFQSLQVNSTGGNSAFGYRALAANTSGSGLNAFGIRALAKNTTGRDNSGFGFQVLFENTTGERNSAFGSNSLTSSTASDNSAFGYQTLTHNTSGTSNTAVGSSALEANTTASGNTAVGFNAMAQNTTGAYNGAFGGAALTNSTESGNVGVGYDAGAGLVAGSYNTFVGYSAGYDGGTPDTTLTNATAIGANSLVTQNNSLVLGSTSVSVGIGTSAPNTKLQVVGNIRVGTGGTLGCVQRFDGTSIAGTCASDARLKTDIRPLDEVLAKVAQLRPVSYRWRADEFPDRHFGTGVNVGLLAQDVERVFPELVSTDEQGYKMVSTSELPYLTLAAVRELKTDNDALRARNASLAADNADIRAELRRLAAVVAELQARQQ